MQDAMGRVLLTIPYVETLNPHIIRFKLTPAEAWMLASWIVTAHSKFNQRLPTFLVPS
jgi:hypothetical protein